MKKSGKAISQVAVRGALSSPPTLQDSVLVECVAAHVAFLVGGRITAAGKRHLISITPSNSGQPGVRDSAQGGVSRCTAGSVWVKLRWDVRGAPFVDDAIDVPVCFCTLSLWFLNL